MQKINLKIVFLSDDFPPQSFGGAGMIAYTDAVALKERGADVTVITRTDDLSKEGEAVHEGLRVVKIFCASRPRLRSYVSLNNRRAVKKIDSHLARIRPDIVHAHNIHEFLSYASLRVARRHAKKVFVTLHDVMSFHYGKLDAARKVSAIEQLMTYRLGYNPLRNFIVRRALARADKLFAVSDALREALELNGIKNVVTLRNGIEVSKWQATPSETERMRESYHLKNAKVILFAGRLSGAKGGMLMLKAFAKVLSRVPEARLLLAGKSESFEKALEALPQNVKSAVTATGWIERESMKNVYSVCDVVAVPSQYLDPFPTVNLEAMACAKAVVATKFGGSKEAVVDKETGFVVDPRNIDEFSNALIRLLEDGELARNMGEKGRQRALEVFDEELHVRQLLACYNAQL